MTRPAPWRFDADGGFDMNRMNAQIEAWGNLLGLGSWEVRFSTNRPSGDDARGCVDIDVIHRRAAIRLDSNIPASQVDRCLVHELLHVLMSDMEDTFVRGMIDLPEGAQEYLRGDWTRAQEWAIERLASLVTGTEREEFQLTPPPPPALSAWETGFPLHDE